MPLTELQRTLLAELAAAPNDDRYLAGAAAMHFAPNSVRYSDALDFFSDSEARVAKAFAADRGRLLGAGYDVEIELSLPGLVRAMVHRDEHATRVEWAHDTAWRFMPLVRDPLGGLLLHPIDLALNKVLALAGRDEPQDFVDVLFVHQSVLPLAALSWAAVGKDPGLTPLSLIELLKRRGHYRPEEFARLHLAVAFDVVAAKQEWLAALSEAEAFGRERPPEESGCLYYALYRNEFVLPRRDASLADQELARHFGAPGGVLPRMTESRVEGFGTASGS